MYSHAKETPGQTGQTPVQKQPSTPSSKSLPAPLVQKQENKTGLPDDLKSGIENLSGYSMDDTRVHYNSSEPAQLQAHAFAQGTDIHVAPGQEKHLAHEAWHVVQQKQGRVQATTQLKGQTINNDTSLENEATTMGEKALQTKTDITSAFQLTASNISNSSQPIQRFSYDENDLKLYTSSTWINTENGDGLKISASLNMDKTKFSTKAVIDSLSDRWEIDAKNVVIVSDDAIKKMVTGYLAHYNLDYIEGETKDLLVTILANRHRELKSEHAEGTELENSVDRVTRHLNRLGKDKIIEHYGTIPGAMDIYNNHPSRLEKRLKDKLTEKFTAAVNPAFYLYKFSNFDLDVNEENAFAKVNNLTLTPTPVLHPMSYADKDSDSDVNVELEDDAAPETELREKICVLISMIYERAISASTEGEAKNAIHLFLKDFGVTIEKRDIKPKPTKNMLPDNDNLYETLIPKLHNYLIGEKLLYDLEKYSEQALEKSYTRIVSANCEWKDLPANIPPNITLNKDETFVFLVKGHATTIKMKVAVTGQMGATHPATLKASDTFVQFNESTNNYDGDVFTKNVESIWRKK